MFYTLYFTVYPYNFRFVIDILVLLLYYFTFIVIFYTPIMRGFGTLRAAAIPLGGK